MTFLIPSPKDWQKVLWHSIIDTIKLPIGIFQIWNYIPLEDSLECAIYLTKNVPQYRKNYAYRYIIRLLRRRHAKSLYQNQ